MKRIDWEDLAWHAVTVIAVIVGAFLMFTMLVYLPVSLYAEAKCLEAGYPKARVSVGLERYCTTLDGAVTVKVEKLK